MEKRNSRLWQAVEGGPVMVIAAHPDDETLAAGGLLSEWPNVYIVHLTDGAPMSHPARKAYAATRQRELRGALALAGIQGDRNIQLGIADQKSAEALVYLALSLKGLLEMIQPTLVLCHPYEGGHPDHDSAAFVLQAAVRLSVFSTAPVLAEFTSYHNASPFRIELLETGTFLPNECEELEIKLTPAQQAAKRSMLDCFESQRQILRHFSVSSERFRLAPDYDFSRPPHKGRLFYDFQNWGIRSTDWRRLAAEADARLSLHRIPHVFAASVLTKNDPENAGSNNPFSHSC